MIEIKARNKIIAGQYEEYKLRIKSGELYLCCLENKLSVDSLTILSIRELGYNNTPNEMSMLTRGLIGNMLLGLLGMIVGFLTAGRREIYRIQIDFADGGTGIAEVDNSIYEKIMHIVC